MSQTFQLKARFQDGGPTQEFSLANFFLHFLKNIAQFLLVPFQRCQFHSLRCWAHRMGTKLTPAILRPELSTLPTGEQLCQAPEDHNIVKRLRMEGGFQTSLAALNLPSTTEFFQAAQAMAETLPEPQHEGAVCSKLGHCIHGVAEDIVQSYPEILLWGLEERLLDIIEDYIQLPVSFLGVNLRKDVPNGEQVGTRLWHLDGEDSRVVKVLVYLNDVQQENGPFQYVPKTVFDSTYRYISPTYLSNQRPLCYDKDMGRIVSPRHWRSCAGPAGSVVIADTTQVFHHGAVPTEHQTSRVALIFAYATREPLNLDFCKEFFPVEHLLPQLKPHLSARQWDCLWGWRQSPEPAQLVYPRVHRPQLTMSGVRS